MMFKYSIIIICFSLYSFAFTQSYNWPCPPFNQQHYINGTFCECRSGSSADIDHFHDGIDIHLPENNAVYSVVDEIITSFGTPSQYGINAYIRAGRYAYVHVIPNTALSVGDSVEAFVTIIGWTNAWNHIHFKDGYPGSERNAIRLNGGITPLIDSYNPSINWVNFYQNNTTTQFPNNRVSGLVDIVCNATDHTDDGPIGNNNGIYKIGFEILNQSGESVYGPRFPFEFDIIPSTDNYIENVYFFGSNTGTYNYIITNNVHSDFSLNVTNWDTGFYTARIMVFDHYLNADTANIEFEVTESDNIPPSPPQLTFILAENNGFFLKWAENQEEDLAGYRLYFSYDLENWNSNHNESILTSNTSEYHAGSFSNNTGFFKMTAVDNAPFPNESSPSDIYVFRKDQINQGLLLIDAYNTNSSQTESFISTAGIVAANFDIGINTINYSVIISDSLQFPDGFIPIVFSGNQQLEWSDEFVDLLIDSSFCIIGSQALASFSSTITGSNFLDSLGFSFGGNIPVPNQLIGENNPFLDFSSETINESLFDSINFFSFTSAEESTYPVIQDSLENILAISSTTSPFLISTIPLELLDNDKRRNYFFRIASYLTGITAEIIDDNETIPDRLSLTFYPNPFNNSGFINISGIQGKYSFRMFNILGQLKWHENLFLETGTNKQIRIPTESLNRMSSGVYFIHVSSTNGKTATQKILYLK